MEKNFIYSLFFLMTVLAFCSLAEDDKHEENSIDEKSGIKNNFGIQYLYDYDPSVYQYISPWKDFIPSPVRDQLWPDGDTGAEKKKTLEEIRKDRELKRKEYKEKKLREKEQRKKEKQLEKEKRELEKQRKKECLKFPSSKPTKSTNPCTVVCERRSKRLGDTIKMFMLKDGLKCGVSMVCQKGRCIEEGALEKILTPTDEVTEITSEYSITDTDTFTTTDDPAEQEREWTTDVIHSTREPELDNDDKVKIITGYDDRQTPSSVGVLVTKESTSTSEELPQDGTSSPGEKKELTREGEITTDEQPKITQAPVSPSKDTIFTTADKLHKDMWSSTSQEPSSTLDHSLKIIQEKPTSDSPYTVKQNLTSTSHDPNTSRSQPTSQSDTNSQFTRKPTTSIERDFRFTSPDPTKFTQETPSRSTSDTSKFTRVELSKSTSGFYFKLTPTILTTRDDPSLFTRKPTSTSHFFKFTREGSTSTSPLSGSEEIIKTSVHPFRFSTRQPSSTSDTSKFTPVELSRSTSGSYFKLTPAVLTTRDDPSLLTRKPTSTTSHFFKFTREGSTSTSPLSGSGEITKTSVHPFRFSTRKPSSTSHRPFMFTSEEHDEPKSIPDHGHTRLIQDPVSKAGDPSIPPTLITEIPERKSYSSQLLKEQSSSTSDLSMASKREETQSPSGDLHYTLTPKRFLVTSNDQKDRSTLEGSRYTQDEILKHPSNDVNIDGNILEN